MDIRNIKEEPPKVEGGAYLEKMFDLQKELMEGYIRIAGPVIPGRSFSITRSSPTSLSA